MRIERWNHMLSERCDASRMNFAGIGAMTLAIGGDTEPDATLSVVVVVAINRRMGLASEGVGLRAGLGVAGIVVVRRSSGSGGVATSCRAALAHTDLAHIIRACRHNTSTNISASI